MPMVSIDEMIELLTDRREYVRPFATDEQIDSWLGMNCRLCEDGYAPVRGRHGGFVAWQCRYQQDISNCHYWQHDMLAESAAAIGYQGQPDWRCSRRRWAP